MKRMWGTECRNGGRMDMVAPAQCQEGTGTSGLMTRSASDDRSKEEEEGETENTDSWAQQGHHSKAKVLVRIHGKRREH